MKKLLACAALVALAFTGSAQAASVLPSGGILYAGQSLTSDNGLYYLTMQTDGHVIMFRTADKRIIWKTDVYNFYNGRLTLQLDRNLVAYRSGTSNTSSNAAWNSRTYSFNDPSAFLKVSNEGSVQLRSGPNGSRVYWSTLPDQSVYQTCGGVITSWAYCMRPRSDARATGYYDACTYKEASIYAAGFVNDGAVMNECQPF